MLNVKKRGLNIADAKIQAVKSSTESLFHDVEAFFEIFLAGAMIFDKNCRLRQIVDFLLQTSYVIFQSSYFLFESLFQSIESLFQSIKTLFKSIEPPFEFIETIL